MLKIKLGATKSISAHTFPNNGNCFYGKKDKTYKYTSING